MNDGSESARIVGGSRLNKEGNQLYHYKIPQEKSEKNLKVINTNHA